MMKFYFEWDINKAVYNFNKHKVSFELASTVFADPNALSIYDEDHSETEDRWITLGISANGNLLVVIHEHRQTSKDTCLIRIISCRKADKDEHLQYRG